MKSAEKIAELNAKREESKSAVKILEDKISENKQKLSETEKKITELETELSELAFSEPAKPVQDVFDSTIENKANAELQTIDVNKAKSELETAKTSAIRNEGLTVQISDKRKLLENANVMLRENQTKRNDKAGIRTCRNGRCAPTSQLYQVFEMLISPLI